jgi:hypothetical protein
VHGGLVWGVVPLDRVASQARKLVEVIQPAVLDDIGGVSPRQCWVPLDLAQGWLTETLNAHYGQVRLERREGLVHVPGLDYDQIEEAGELADKARWCIGWINHDKTTSTRRRGRTRTSTRSGSRRRRSGTSPSARGSRRGLPATPAVPVTTCCTASWGGGPLRCAGAVPCSTAGAVPRAWSAGF